MVARGGAGGLGCAPGFSRAQGAAPVAVDVGLAGAFPEGVRRAGKAVPVAAYVRLAEERPSDLFQALSVLLQPVLCFTAYFCPAAVLVER
jgi:hypothetical protein